MIIKRAAKVIMGSPFTNQPVEIVNKQCGLVVLKMLAERGSLMHTRPIGWEPYTHLMESRDGYYLVELVKD